jgi:hypothetical protein
LTASTLATVGDISCGIPQSVHANGTILFLLVHDHS